MILAGAEIQVLVATRPVDFRNYAARTIMRSSPPTGGRRHRLSTA